MNNETSHIQKLSAHVEKMLNEVYSIKNDPKALENQCGIAGNHNLNAFRASLQVVMSEYFEAHGEFLCKGLKPG